MAAVVAGVVADGQVASVAVAALAQGLDVLQRGLKRPDMAAANPARHHAMKLACYCFVDFVAGQGEFAH